MDEYELSNKHMPDPKYIQANLNNINYGVLSNDFEYLSRYHKLKKQQRIAELYLPYNLPFGIKYPFVSEDVSSSKNKPVELYHIGSKVQSLGKQRQRQHQPSYLLSSDSDDIKAKKPRHVKYKDLNISLSQDLNMTLGDLSDLPDWYDEETENAKSILEENFDKLSSAAVTNIDRSKQVKSNYEKALRDKQKYINENKVWVKNQESNNDQIKIKKEAHINLCKEEIKLLSEEAKSKGIVFNPSILSHEERKRIKEEKHKISQNITETLDEIRLLKKKIKSKSTDVGELDNLKIERLGKEEIVAQLTAKKKQLEVYQSVSGKAFEDYMVLDKMRTSQLDEIRKKENKLNGDRDAFEALQMKGKHGDAKFEEEIKIKSDIIFTQNLQIEELQTHVDEINSHMDSEILKLTKILGVDESLDHKRDLKYIQMVFDLAVFKSQKLINEIQFKLTLRDIEEKNTNETLETYLLSNKNDFLKSYKAIERGIPKATTDDTWIELVKNQSMLYNYANKMFEYMNMHQNPDSIKSLTDKSISITTAQTDIIKYANKTLHEYFKSPNPVSQKELNRFLIQFSCRHLSDDFKIIGRFDDTYNNFIEQVASRNNFDLKNDKDKILQFLRNLQFRLEASTAGNAVSQELQRLNDALFKEDNFNHNLKSLNNIVDTFDDLDKLIRDINSASFNNLAQPHSSNYQKEQMKTLEKLAQRHNTTNKAKIVGILKKYINDLQPNSKAYEANTEVFSYDSGVFKKDSPYKNAETLSDIILKFDKKYDLKEAKHAFLPSIIEYLILWSNTHYEIITFTCETVFKLFNDAWIKNHNNESLLSQIDEIDPKLFFSSLFEPFKFKFQTDLEVLNKIFENEILEIKSKKDTMFTSLADIKFKAIDALKRTADTPTKGKYMGWLLSGNIDSLLYHFMLNGDDVQTIKKDKQYNEFCFVINDIINHYERVIPRSKKIKDEVFNYLKVVNSANGDFKKKNLEDIANLKSKQQQLELQIASAENQFGTALINNDKDRVLELEYELNKLKSELTNNIDLNAKLNKQNEDLRLDIMELNSKNLGSPTFKDILNVNNAISTINDLEGQNILSSNNIIVNNDQIDVVNQLLTKQNRLESENKNLQSQVDGATKDKIELLSKVQELEKKYDNLLTKHKTMEDELNKDTAKTKACYNSIAAQGVSSQSPISPELYKKAIEKEAKIRRIGEILMRMVDVLNDENIKDKNERIKKLDPDKIIPKTTATFANVADQLDEFIKLQQSSANKSYTLSSIVTLFDKTIVFNLDSQPELLKLIENFRVKREAEIKWVDGLGKEIAKLKETIQQQQAEIQVQSTNITNLTKQAEEYKKQIKELTKENIDLRKQLGNVQSVVNAAGANAAKNQSLTQSFMDKSIVTGLSVPGIPPQVKYEIKTTMVNLQKAYPDASSFSLIIERKMLAKGEQPPNITLLEMFLMGCAQSSDLYTQTKKKISITHLKMLFLIWILTLSDRNEKNILFFNDDEILQDVGQPNTRDYFLILQGNKQTTLFEKQFGNKKDLPIMNDYVKLPQISTLDKDEKVN